MQPKFKSDKESQIAVSQASTPQLFSTLVRGSIERSELIDRILKLDIDPKIKLSFIQETGSQTSREFVEGMVSSIERDSGKIPGRSPWSQLAEFVNWESVGSSIGELDSQEPRKPAPTPVESQPKRESWVYFIESKGSSLIKIGYSITPEKRLKDLQTSSPEALELLGTIPGGKAEEAELHKKFERHREHGEWFRKVPELATFIDRQTSKA